MPPIVEVLLVTFFFISIMIGIGVLIDRLLNDMEEKNDWVIFNDDSYICYVICNIFYWSFSMRTYINREVPISISKTTYARNRRHIQNCCKAVRIANDIRMTNMWLNHIAYFLYKRKILSRGGE